MLLVALVAGGLIWADRTVSRYEVQTWWWRELCGVYGDRLTIMYADFTRIYHRSLGRPPNFDALARNPELQQQIDRDKAQYMADIDPDALYRAVDFLEDAQYSNCAPPNNLLAWVYLNGIGVPENRQKAESHMHLDVMDRFTGFARGWHSDDGPFSPHRLRSIDMLGFWYESAAWYDRVQAMTPEEIVAEGDRWVSINRNLGEMLHRWAVLRGYNLSTGDWERTPGAELGLRRTLAAISREPWRYRPFIALFYIDLALHTDVATPEEVAEAEAYLIKEKVRGSRFSIDASRVYRPGNQAPHQLIIWSDVEGM